MNKLTTPTHYICQRIAAFLASVDEVGPTERLYVLSLAGWSQRRLCDALGVKSPSVSRVIAGTTVSFPIAEAIATVTGSSVYRLFPDVRYDKRDRWYTHQEIQTIRAERNPGAA